MNLHDAISLKFIETAFDQLVCDAPPPVCRINDDMLEIASASIVTRKRTTDNPTVDFGKEAHPRIAAKIAIDRFA